MNYRANSTKVGYLVFPLISDNKFPFFHIVNS